MTFHSTFPCVLSLCLYLFFHRLSLTFHRPSLTLHRLSLTFHRLSLTFHRLSLTFQESDSLLGDAAVLCGTCLLSELWAFENADGWGGTGEHKKDCRGLSLVRSPPFTCVLTACRR